ncbi:MAG: MetQ/NlpA family ABC transporter substrate-binding protein [Bacillota bacterium]|nr:MetQ/NlpA family ABC transporter substrate-binding protein [Bacillota bacterium]
MKKKLTGLIGCILLLAISLTGCGGQEAKTPAGDENKLVVGATAIPHAGILEVVKPLLAEENITLEIKEFTDYSLLNPALNDKQIDANFFQHVPFLNDYNAKNDTDLVWTVKVHNEPMGIYSENVTNVEDVKEGASIGIPNDATNGGRALMVLEAANLIKLKENAGVTATDRDISENPKKIKIVMMDAAMLPRSLEDLDLCVINSNYAIEGGLNPVTDSIFMEPKDSPFANILAVRSENKNNELIQKLGESLQSPEVKKYLEENYPGACVPAFE